MSTERALPMGVIGLGQCGGNLAAMFAHAGYPALALNTSLADLRQLTDLGEESRLPMGIDGVSGTGGNASVGAACLEAREEEILQAVERLPGAEMLLVAAGLGGGTGANLPGLLLCLSRSGRPLIALGVLPASSEPYTAKLNALQAVNALIDAPFDSLVLVDNQRLYRSHGGASMDQFFREGNRHVVENLDGWLGLPEGTDRFPLRSFDAEALRQTLLSGGLTVFGRVTLDVPLDAEALLDATRGVLSDHPVLCAGFAPEDAVVISAVLVMDEGSLADTPASLFEAYSAGLKEAGAGAETRLGLYRGPKEAPELYIMAGGLPLPKRVGELLEEASEEAARFAAKQAPRSRFQRLDLSALAPPGGRPLVPPSTHGKGMAKSAPPGAAQTVTSTPPADRETSEPLVDLDFEDDEPPVVEEEIIDDLPTGSPTGVRDF